jgi:hypothetical protein
MFEERGIWMSPTAPEIDKHTVMGCLDIKDCCKWVPKSDFLFWSDRAPYDTFTDKNISELIPNRYPQARVKYLSQECVPVSTCACASSFSWMAHVLPTATPVLLPPVDLHRHQSKCGPVGSALAACILVHSSVTDLRLVLPC